jgi:hypothetical protein
VRQQTGGNDRPPRTQVLINLERRVRAGTAWRDKDVGRIEKERNFIRRPLPRKDHRVRNSGTHGLLTRDRYLLRTAARQDEARVRASGDHVPCCGEKEIESLVGFERACVEHQRGIARETKLTPDSLSRPGNRSIAGAGSVLDQHGRHTGLNLAHDVGKMRTDDNHDR